MLDPSVQFCCREEEEKQQQLGGGAEYYTSLLCGSTILILPVEPLRRVCIAARVIEATERGPQQSAFSTEILPYFLYLRSYDNLRRTHGLKSRMGRKTWFRKC